MKNRTANHRTLSSRIRRIGMRVAMVAVMMAPALVVTPTAAQAACSRSTICNPWGSGVNLRATPHVSGTPVWLNYGDGLYINCYQYGDGISGPWGYSNIWDYVSWTTQYGYRYYGYVSDTYVYTGTNGPPSWVGRCPPNLVGNA